MEMNVLAVDSSLSLYIFLSVFHVPDTERRHLGDLRCQHSLCYSVAHVVICWLLVRRPIFNTVPVCEGFVVDWGTQSHYSPAGCLNKLILPFNFRLKAGHWHYELCSKWQNGI